MSLTQPAKTSGLPRCASFVEVDPAVDGGDAHPVAVVAHARDDLLKDSPRVDDAAGHVFNFRGGDAEDVGVGDGAGGQAGAHDVADAPADAGGRAAVGLNGGGVVVGFDFDADGVGVVEADDAGVVFEDGDAPSPRKLPPEASSMFA